MSAIRTISAVAAGSGLVYVLYLSKLEVPLSLSFDPSTIALASASILSSVVVFIFSHGVMAQVRALSESNRWVGWVPFSAGILIYLLGTISDYPDLLHWLSLWILVPSLAVVLLGIRNSAFALPLLSLLLLVAPSVPYPVKEYQSVLLLLFSASMVALVVFSEFLPRWVRPIALAPFAFETLNITLPAYASAGVFVLSVGLSSAAIIFLRRNRAETGWSCELDASPINAGRRGCVKCGRVYEWRETSLVGSEVLVLAAIMIVALAIGLVSFPLVTVTDTGVNLTSVSPGQTSSVPLIAAPSGFLENSSAPSPVLERLYSEQVVVLKQFFPAVHPENFSYTVYLEAASSHTFFVKHWQYLGGYNRTTETIRTNGSLSTTVYSTLLEANGTSIVAVSYEIPVWVVFDGRYTTMNIGVSALAKPAFHVTPQGYEAIKQQMILYFVAPEERLAEASVWTGDVSGASSTLASVLPFVPLGAGATLILGLMSSVLSADKKDQRLLGAIDELSHYDQMILAGALRLRMRRTPKSGADLLSVLNSKTREPITIQAFYNRLGYLEKLGYFRQTPTLVGGRVRFLWRLTAP